MTRYRNVQFQGAVSTDSLEFSAGILPFSAGLPIAGHNDYMPFFISGTKQCNACCKDYSFPTPTELIKSCNDYSFLLWIPWLRIRLVVVG